MKKINAEIIADSKNEHGNRITTFVLTYPRIIHAELLTHRLFSRNAASSRAIPASKMIKDIQEDPFVPVAWQKAHKGMQGTEYFEDRVDIENRTAEWLYNVNVACSTATILNDMKVTKQLINRTLEPYQWYTCIVTFTEGENFFELRCPQYAGAKPGATYRSMKDFAKGENLPEALEWTDVQKLEINKGAGEIHISLLAEAMWDAMNESEPKQLKAGEWHIPFGDNMDKERIFDIWYYSREEAIEQWLDETGASTELDFNPELEYEKKFASEFDDIRIKIATARCARVSYLNFEGKDDYEADLKLFQRLYDMKHMSPFEHCARAMDNSTNWSGNFRGFVQLRKEIE
jgi:hypothetical protein